MMMMEQGCVAVAMVQRQVTVVQGMSALWPWTRLSSDRSYDSSFALAQTERHMDRRAHIHAAEQPRLSAVCCAAGSDIVVRYPQHLPRERVPCQLLGRLARAPTEPTRSSSSSVRVCRRSTRGCFPQSRILGRQSVDSRAPSPFLFKRRSALHTHVYASTTCFSASPLLYR